MINYRLIRDGIIYTVEERKTGANERKYLSLFALSEF